MDHNTFIAGLARQAGKNPAEVKNLTSALIASIKNSLCDLDTVAIPGFGRFEAVKTEEYIAVDKADGITKLFPPAVAVKFIAGSMLKKRMKHE